MFVRELEDGQAVDQVLMVRERETRRKRDGASYLKLVLADRTGTTRSAVAVDLWADRLGGAVVAIGNAPTALFRLLELVDDGAPTPAAVLGGPVGFVGSAQSKQELIDRPRGMAYLVVQGRRGGSAMAAAAVNAIASDRE